MQPKARDTSRRYEDIGGAGGRAGAVRRKETMRTRLFDVAALHHWSVKQIAHRTGLTARGLYYVKRGQRKPGARFITAVLRAYPLYKYEELFYDDEYTNHSLR